MSENLSLPMSIRLPAELEAKVVKIAEVNHLSKGDVIRLCLAQAVPAIEANGLTIAPTLPQAKRRAA